MPILPLQSPPQMHPISPPDTTLRLQKQHPPSGTRLMMIQSNKIQLLSHTVNEERGTHANIRVLIKPPRAATVAWVGLSHESLNIHSCISFTRFGRLHHITTQTRRIHHSRATFPQHVSLMPRVTIQSLIDIIDIIESLGKESVKGP